MKKTQIFSIFLYSFFIITVIGLSVLSLAGIEVQDLWQNFYLLERLAVYIFLLNIVVTFVLVFLLHTVILTNQYRTNKQLKKILANKPINLTHKDEQSRLLTDVSKKVQHLSAGLQLSQNQQLEQRELIIEDERKRIARELHDTVSQELFAANMIVAGVSTNLATMTDQQVAEQLGAVHEVLETAQKDLRILLLQLRPLELEGKSLVEGFDLILQEVKDKSHLQVLFKHDVKELPKRVEEHSFRIAQEFINNTLRHAQATHLSVYLLQTPHDLHLKMTDDGIGFNQDEVGEVSYGLKNISERVTDMAGTLKIKTAAQKGVDMDIHIPLLKG